MSVENETHAHRHYHDDPYFRISSSHIVYRRIQGFCGDPIRADKCRILFRVPGMCSFGSYCIEESVPAPTINSTFSIMYRVPVGLYQPVLLRFHCDVAAIQVGITTYLTLTMVEAHRA